LGAGGVHEWSLGKNAVGLVGVKEELVPAVRGLFEDSGIG
jgi:hypothetical protein